MRSVVRVFLLILSCNTIYFGQSTIVLNEMDSILIQVNKSSKSYYSHTIKAGETIYSLANFFSVNYKDLLIINELDQNEIIPVGSIILIPFNTDVMFRTSEIPNPNCIPVFYKVKKSETLFRISHVYFYQSIEDLVLRNNIHSFSLQPDQLLKVGWWPIHDSVYSKEVSQTTEINLLDTLTHDTLVSRSVNIDSLITLTNADSLNSFIQEDSTFLLEPFDIISTTGIAIWEKSDENEETLLVLHKTAKLGSVIKLQNPVTDQITIAQVVGHIPLNVYTDDIDIVVSKAVAHKLGALDTRFQILMTYYE